MLGRHERGKRKRREKKRSVDDEHADHSVTGTSCQGWQVIDWPYSCRTERINEKVLS